MEEKHYILNEIAAFFSKSWTFIFTIMTGVVAKISLDELNGKTRNWRQRLAVMGISAFGGSITAMYLIAHNQMIDFFWIVPVATLFTETVVMWIVKNHKRIFFQLLNVFTNRAGVPPTQVDEKPEKPETNNDIEIK